MNRFITCMQRATGESVLASDGLSLVQVNLGLLCNLSCTHCHVAAGPTRSEVMDWGTMAAVLSLVRAAAVERVDLTGGAPEMNPRFRRFVAALRKEGVTVQVRTNLALLTQPEMAELPAFLRDHQVQLVASLPCYLEENVDRQRGGGTYARAMAALRILNGLGYGGDDPALSLDLVYNPGGPFLPPAQCTLEQDYKRELAARFGVRFSHLLTIANMPIGRYRATLRREGREGEYWQLLETSFNSGTLPGLMCRQQVSVGWDGTLYDCDFNLALGLPVALPTPRVDAVDPAALARRPIVTGDHCLGCTAGSGSSCGGALVA